MKSYKLLFIVLAIFLIGCGKKTPNPDIKDEIIRAELANGTGVYENFIDQFKLDEIKIKLIYKSNKTEEIPLTKDMISQEDFENLFTVGSHIVSVKYKEYNLDAYVEIHETGGSNQYNLPAIVLYSLTEEVDDKFVSHYYTCGSAKFITFQVQYTYDPSEVSEIVVSPSEEVDGSLVSSVKDGTITITYTQEESQTEPTEFFTISYKASEKYSNININYLFNNAFYDYNETSVFAINNIAFYER